jgi:hypothetical protein
MTQIWKSKLCIPVSFILLGGNKSPVFIACSMWHWSKLMLLFRTSWIRMIDFFSFFFKICH